MTVSINNREKGLDTTDAEVVAILQKAIKEIDEEKQCFVQTAAHLLRTAQYFAITVAQPYPIPLSLIITTTTLSSCRPHLNFLNGNTECG
jgi:hypothetical protein